MTGAAPSTISQDTWNRLSVSRESLARLERLVELILKWQPHVNLVADSTLPDIWNRHILDSAQILPLIPTGTRAIADLGSGGGFPALVLAACLPARVHAYESNGKKAAFLAEAFRTMGVVSQVHRERLELDSAPKQMPKVEVVTARAFAPLSQLLGYALPFLSSGATGLFHKGQEVDTELTEAARIWKLSSRKHVSLVDPKSVILEVMEVSHV